MSESNVEQQQDEFSTLLENVERHSEENFNRIRDRLFDFYYADIQNELVSRGEIDGNATKLEIQKLYESEDKNLKVEDLRLVKAFLPYSIQEPENIPDWVPDEIRSEILEELNSDEKSERYYAYNVGLGVVQLLRDEGLLSSQHPDSPVVVLGDNSRLKFESVLSGLGAGEVYPTYAVVEKQEDDEAYVRQVGPYGVAWEKEEMGILAVLSMNGDVGRRATFTFGDSTLSLTKKELRKFLNMGINSESWEILEEMMLLGDFSRKTELENDISTLLFPDNDYTCEAKVFREGGRPSLLIIPSEQTIFQNILGVSSLLRAFELNRKLREWRIISRTADYLEAQIFGPLKPPDCERILINESVKSYLDRIMETMPDVKQKYEELKEKGIIRYHQMKLQ